MLEFIAFLCGLAVMVLEMTGSRLLAPYLGSSVLVWTALIGVILAFLSLGYWMGGKMADKSPSPKKLAAIILAAAFSVLMIGLFQEGVLAKIASVTSRPEIGASVAATVLFGPASLLLGMVSPYIVRVALELRKVPVEKTGAVIGRFSALSAIGSILGTFLGGYVLISWVGSRLTVFMMSSMLMAVAILALWGAKMPFRRRLRVLAMPIVGLAASLLCGYLQIMTEYGLALKGNWQIDTRYERVEVFSGLSGGRPYVQLSTPPRLVQSAMYADKPEELALSYTKHYSLAWQLKPESGRFLMLGGAGYSIPKYILHTRPQATIDVVEIDPQMTRIAKRFFALPDDPRLTTHHEDARTYLNRYAARSGGAPGYDVIMGDTFSSAYNIPFQLGTVECAQKIYDSLADDGIYMCNIITAVTGDKAMLLRSIRAGFEAVFPDVRTFPLLYSGSAGQVQNVMLMASKKPLELPTPEELERRGTNVPSPASLPYEAKEEIRIASSMLRNEWRIRVTDDLPPLSDDFAPVERYALPLLN